MIQTILFIIGLILIIVGIVLTIISKGKIAFANTTIDEAQAIAEGRTAEQKAIIDDILNKQAEITKMDAHLQESKSNYDKLEIKTQAQKEQIETIRGMAKDELEQLKETNRQAAEHYFDVLEQSYEKKEQEISQKKKVLELDIQSVQSELEKYKNLRAAAREALAKEQEVKEDMARYSLQPSQQELNDIIVLQRVKRELNKPRILSMLIWQTYWQPLAKKQFPQILGPNTVMGIYKITNQQTGECYIGQAVDVDKRWKEHCKAGLGIDTPVGNKLYKAIDSYGLENFTFELLEKCSREELNEKEKYFISLYEADKFGYNGTVGNK